MYLQKVKSKKTLEKTLFFVEILKATDEKGRIRIRNWIRDSVLWIRWSGSGPKCHGSTTHWFYLWSEIFEIFKLFDSRNSRNLGTGICSLLGGTAWILAPVPVPGRAEGTWTAGIWGYSCPSWPQAAVAGWILKTKHFFSCLLYSVVDSYTGSVAFLPLDPGSGMKKIRIRDKKKPRSYFQELSNKFLS